MWTRKRAFALLGLIGVVACLVAATGWHFLAASIAALSVFETAKPTPIAAFSVPRGIAWQPGPEIQGVSPDGRWLYVKGAAIGKNELIEWQIGKRIVIENSHRPWCKFSPDGKFIAALEDRKLRLWNLTKDTEQRLGCTSANEATIHFSPDSQYIAVVAGNDQGSRPFLEIWDSHTANLYASIRVTDLFGQLGHPFVFNTAWGADHAFLADKSRIDRVKNSSQIEQVCCWDLQKATVRFRIENLANGSWRHPTWRVSPDGKTCVAVVLGGPNEELVLPHPFIAKQELIVPKKPRIQAWNVANGELLWQRPFASDRAFFDLSFTPDSKKVAISSRDLANDLRVEAQVWNLADGDVQAKVELEAKGQTAMFLLTPNGRYLECHHVPQVPWQLGNDDEKRIVGGWWELHDTEARPALTFDGDGSWFDRAGTRHVLFPSDEKSKTNFDRRIEFVHNGWHEDVEAPGVVATMSPDERWVAIRVHRLGPPRTIGGPKWYRSVQDSNPELRLVDLRDGKVSPFLSGVFSWMFTPDGKRLITTGHNEIQVWDLPLIARAGQPPPIVAAVPPNAP